MDAVAYFEMTPCVTDIRIG